MKKNIYTFYWLTGDKDILSGYDPADALNNAGYGAGALRALDFYKAGDNNEYVWDTESHKWKNKPTA